MNMPFDNIDNEIGPDAASIDDVLLCWESGEEDDDDDDDSIRMIHKIREDLLDSFDVNVIPTSPRTSPFSYDGRCKDLKELMKKYPDFVPSSLPDVPVKRSRPVCTFVNFMGTRDQPKPAKKEKRKTKAAAKPMKVTPKATEPSPYPTDAPNQVKKPSKRSRTISKDFPVVTPPGVPKRQKAFVASPMPSLAPMRARQTVSPTP